MEGVFHTGLIWIRFWQLDDIKRIYDNITVLTNEDKEQEIGFKDFKVAEKFFEGVYKYSMALQQNENKFTMQFIADCIKELIDTGLLTKEQLYKLSEADIIDIIEDNRSLGEKWNIFANSNKINRTEEKPSNKYYVSIDCKKRYVNPLCIHNDKVFRLSSISDKSKKLLESYLEYKDSTYSYIDF